jgi:hypothetical protein
MGRDRARSHDRAYFLPAFQASKKNDRVFAKCEEARFGQIQRQKRRSKDAKKRVREEASFSRDAPI